MSQRIVIAYWLIPAEPRRSILQALIADLARRHDAAVFEPHLTIFAGANHPEAAQKVLSHVGRHCAAITLDALEIRQSNEFIKTLFVQFAPSADLERIKDAIRSAARDSSDYDLNPHLSLLYKTLHISVRSELANSINLPFLKITFNAITAVRCISPTQTTADIAAWRVIGTTPLST
ncbi:MAG TPA: 2'-5' RNA ligase family protein [Candidatus Udaeobacter sp.]|nr:2'-5' RNA ligase family protein [Candidatus Udaeobacter sp.]